MLLKPIKNPKSTPRVLGVNQGKMGEWGRNGPITCYKGGIFLYNILFGGLKALKHPP